jgi:hypothetical protein
MRFHHLIEQDTWIPIADKQFIPSAPQVYAQRTSLAPRFYSDIFSAFVPELPTFVYLPPLFIKLPYKEFKDASFKMVVFECGKL